MINILPSECADTWSLYRVPAGTLARTLTSLASPQWEICHLRTPQPQHICSWEVTMASWLCSKQPARDHARQKVAMCQGGSPYLFHHHSELALCAQNRLHTREPLYTGEHFRWPNEDLSRIKAIWIIKEETLWEKWRGEKQHKGL